MPDGQPQVLGRILVGCDFSPASQAAFRCALTLGAKCEAVVEVLHAWQSSTRSPVTVAGPLAKQALKDFVVSFQARGSAQLQRRTEYGDPFHALLGVCLRGVFDLVVAGLHGRLTSRMEPGTVVMNLLRSAPTAVLVVPPTPAGNSSPLTEAAARLVPQRVLAVVDRPDPHDSVRAFAEALAVRLGAQVVPLAATAGEASSVIVEMVRSEACDLVVMRRGKQGTPAASPGSSLDPTTDQLLRKVPAPLLFLPQAERRAVPPTLG